MKKFSYLFISLLTLTLLFANGPVRAAVELPNGIYHDTVDDLTVKVMGGYVKAQRTWYAGKWHHTRAWNNLQIEYDALSGGIIRLGRNYDSYKKGAAGLSSEVFTFSDNTKQLDKNAFGFRWSDKEGNWIDYSTEGRILKYGDRNNVEVSFIYDADGNRTGVKDHFGTQVLWYTYDTLGQVTSVRDHLDPLQARTVQYIYVNGLLTEVIDVLGNTWTYGYKYTRTTEPSVSYGTTTTSSTGSTGLRVSRLDYTLLLVTKVDPDGVTTTIDYNANKKVASVKRADGTGPLYEYNYDKTKKIYYTRVKQSSGRVEETWFDKDGEVVRRAVNGITTETIVRDTRKETSTNELGQKTIREYDGKDNLLKVTYPDNSSEIFAVESKYSNVTQYTNENGVVTKYEYDATGNLLKMIEAFGKPEQRITEFTYDTYGNVLTIKRLADANTAEALTTYTYDNQGNLKTITSVIDATSSVTVNFDTYNKIGNVLSVRDGRNTTWTRTYDAKGQLTSVTVPPDETYTFKYNKAGKLTHVYDPYNKLTESRYDTNGRRNAVLDPYLAKSQFNYNANGQLSQTLDPQNKTKNYGYDGAGRLASITDGAGNVTAAFYGDAANAARSEQLAAIQYPTYKESYAYDKRNRRSKFTQHLSDTLSHTQLNSYDAVGNLVSHTDAEGNTTTYEYDALNRVIKVTKPDTRTIEYKYDNRDNLIQVINENKITLRVFAYDRINRKKTELWPGTELFTSTYDANGNLATKLDAKGQLTKYTYSAANRLEKTENFATAAATAPSKTVDYTYNKLGKLLTYNDGTTSGAYTYDDVQRKLTESVNYGIPIGQTVPLIYSHSYSYYNNGRKNTYTGPDSVAYTYSYDVANRLSSIDLPGEGLFNVNAYQWNAPATITTPGGGSQNFSYDALMRLTNITDKDPAQNPLLQYGYGYDKVGNIKSKTTEHGNYVYGYDKNYRLTTVDNPAIGAIPSLTDETYTYDAAGNRLTAANTSGNWVYNANNQLKSYNGITHTYDANGNTATKLENALTTTYVYDENDRLKDIKDNGGVVTASYYYDPFGRRLWKDIAGTRTYFAYADEGLVAEADATGAITQQYGWSPDGLWGTNPLYTKTSQGYAYYLNDHLGTPQKLVNKAGATVWSAKYAVFGEAFIESNTITNNLRFAGQYYDAETGEHYNYFRNYNPATGSYTTSDPIGLAGGLNAYAYVSGNPISWVDPYGLCKCGNIEEIARKYEGSDKWSFEKIEVDNSCNLFIDDVLEESDSPDPDRHPWWPGDYELGAGQDGWSDPDANIPNFVQVTDPQPGDIVGARTSSRDVKPKEDDPNFWAGSYHVGIVIRLEDGSLGVMSHASETDTVRRSGWPFAANSNPDPYYNEDDWKPVFWRCSCSK